MTIPVRPAHDPVLLAEVLDALGADRGGLFFDGTFGAGGYTAAILAAHPENRVVATDRDPDAIAAGAGLVAGSGGRLRLVPGRFGDVATLVEPGSLAGLVLDIGVSSMQLDQPERGFSFRQDGPLDMRMERDGPSAADLVNAMDETDLANVIYRYGEERRSRAIARAIAARRREAPFERTADLAAIVAKVVRAEPGLHPATRTFQALRIAVNDELGQLEAALAASERALAPGGRLAIVTFHSLEDRIVKRFLQEKASRAPRASRHLPGTADAVPVFTLSRGTKPVTSGEAELRRNPRARSAKLRSAERTDAPAGEDAP